MVRLQTEPIVAEALIEAARGDEDGAVALFLGVVRNHNDGRRVQQLEYSAYEEMAEAEMARIEQQALQRFDISRLIAVHRTGLLRIGEVAVGVAVASVHRASGMDACRFVIDSLKKTVPIWKRELFEGGGETWVEGEQGPL